MKRDDLHVFRWKNVIIGHVFRWKNVFTIEKVEAFRDFDWEKSKTHLR